MPLPGIIEEPVTIIWLRRDLRLHDHAAFDYAIRQGRKIVILFIFDENILINLDRNDKRVSFIYQAINSLNDDLNVFETGVCLRKGSPADVFRDLLNIYDFHEVVTANDYEPYAIQRDREVAKLLADSNIGFTSLKDQVIFEKNEILNNSRSAFKVYTPYAARWRDKLTTEHRKEKKYALKSEYFIGKEYIHSDVYSLKDIRFIENENIFSKAEIDENKLRQYSENRDKPYLDGTSLLGVHLRFGTISIRKLVTKAIELNQTFLNELIWREFFMQILWHFPNVENEAFKPDYRFIKWRNNEEEFNKWCGGNTGYPLVDAGMRQLNETGFMHNRVRMVAASFLTKHLLIDWRWGEKYFADKLMDFDLASNNGNWQWAAGTGCDAAPYFRIFNPAAQAQKFDPQNIYIKKWVKEFGSAQYINPVVEHTFARNRCLETYKNALTEIKGQY